jgi:hypothetical protein
MILNEESLLEISFDSSEIAATGCEAISKKKWTNLTFISLCIKSNMKLLTVSDRKDVFI